MDILEIQIHSDNLLETKKFYCDLLGFDLLEENEDCLSLKTGRSKMVFLKSENSNPIYHFAFNIPLNKLNEAFLFMQKKLEIVKIDANEYFANFESWNAKSFYFYDNNGNILEFIARFDLQNESNKTFDISSVISLSEIGLVSENPNQLAENLIAKYELDFFKKGTKSEAFSTIGDDDGLIIIVKTKRIWYATNIEARAFFTKIKISEKGNLRELNF